MDSCPLQGAPRPSPSALDLAIPAAVERALVSPTRCPGLTPAFESARVQSVRHAPTELGGQRGGVRAGRARVRAAKASAGGACDHGARGWARSAARWWRRGEQWRPRALESRPRCWGCCCCGGSAGWDVPGARGSRQSLSPRRRPAKPQFPRAVIPRLSRCCTLVPDAHPRGGSTFLQEERLGGELSGNNRSCVRS